MTSSDSKRRSNFAKFENQARFIIEGQNDGSFAIAPKNNYRSDKRQRLIYKQKCATDILLC
jgi:hypothetical protein